jgi:hypothetical protein
MDPNVQENKMYLIKLKGTKTKNQIEVFKNEKKFLQNVNMQFCVNTISSLFNAHFLIELLLDNFSPLL